MNDPKALELMDYMITIDGKLDLFDLSRSDCGLELLFLGVRNSAKGKGIAGRLVEETIRVGKNYDGFPKPQFVIALFTSTFSQKAGKRAGMETVLEIPFSESESNGEKYSEMIGPSTPNAVLSIIKL